MTTHVQQTLPFPWQGGRQCSLQLLIQPWICVPGTHYGWVDRGSVEYEVYPTPLRMASTANQTPDLSILSPNALSIKPHVSVIRTTQKLMSVVVWNLLQMTTTRISPWSLILKVFSRAPTSAWALTWIVHDSLYGSFVYEETMIKVK